MSSPTVLLADDHQIVREGVRALLERSGMEVVAEACNGREAVELAARLRPDVAVLDHLMPILNGRDAGVQIRRVSPRTRSIMLTMSMEDPYVLGAMQVGFFGYVVKSQAATDLVNAIREVLRNSIYLSPSISRTVVDAWRSGTTSGTDPLTPREREVLQLVAEGHTTKGIASALGLSFKTAETHRTRIMRKLEIHEVAGLVRYAIRQGMIGA
jgi:two-component system response regulator NreC